MSPVVRRHQKDTKTFGELTAKEQALAINAHTVWYLKAARAHGRRISLHKGGWPTSPAKYNSNSSR
jgi:hypothetical protein